MRIMNLVFLKCNENYEFSLSKIGTLWHWIFLFGKRIKEICVFGLFIVVEFNSWFFFFLDFEKYNHFKLDTRISKGLYARWQQAHDGHHTSGDNWKLVLLDDSCVNYIKYSKDRSIGWI